MAWRPWLLGFLAALWALLVLNAPAFAAIQRFVDSRGVVHICNVAPRTPGGETEAANREANGPVPPARLAKSAPALPAGAGLPSRPEPTVAPPQTPQNTSGKLAIQAPVESGTAPGTTRGGGSQPGWQKVSYPSAKPASILFERKERRLQAGPASAPEGSIRRFRDRRGVLHITNVPPEVDSAPLLTAANPRGAEGRSPGRQEIRSSPALRPVAWTEGPGLPARLASPAPGAPDAGPGAIRHYRDANGVLHIENVTDPGREPAPQALPRLARPRLVRKKIDITGPDGSPVLPWKPASQTLADSPPGTEIREIPAPNGKLLVAGTIRRYRDAKGVLHIESVEPPAPPFLPAPVFLARPRSRPEAGRFAAAASPPGNGPPIVSARAAPAVTAIRDSQGRLVVRNREPEATVARGPRQEKNLARLAPILQEASARYGLPVNLIKAVIKVESNFAMGAVSPRGAMGLMQLMPDTAVFLGVQNAFDPQENIHGGCRYLRLLLDYFAGSLPLALAAYNAGYGRVVSCGFKVPDIKETQEFVTQVLGLYFTAGKRHRGPLV